MIVVKRITYNAPRSNEPLVSIADLQLVAGEMHVLLGANGAGKSTLLKCLCGDLPDMCGDVDLAGQPLHTYSKAQLAHKRAVLPQTMSLPFAMSVRDIIAFGRDIYRHSLNSQFDAAVINQVMSWLELTHLANNNYQMLSGGEQHRTQIARTLVQIMATPEASLAGRILFLDEPTNHLDIRHQFSLMQLLNVLKKRSLTIVCVLHDIALALNHADTLVLLNAGKMVSHTTPAQLVARDDLNNAYGLTLNAHWSSHYQRYMIVP